MLFVIHLAERDWHRFIEEWCLFVQTYHRGSNQLHQQLEAGKMTPTRSKYTGWKRRIAYQLPIVGFHAHLFNIWCTPNFTRNWTWPYSTAQGGRKTYHKQGQHLSMPTASATVQPNLADSWRSYTCTPICDSKWPSWAVCLQGYARWLLPKAVDPRKNPKGFAGIVTTDPGKQDGW